VNEVMKQTIGLACFLAGMIYGQAPAAPQAGPQAVQAQTPAAQPAPASAPQPSPQPAPAAAPAPKPAAPASVPVETTHPRVLPGQVQTVYMLSMRHGMDQYLAEQIVKLGLYQVTTDPTHADALFTDQIGPSLEARLNMLYPPPTPPEETAASEEDDKGRHKDADERRKEKERNEFMATRSTWGGGKGTVFLVDRYGRGVIWSIYQVPKNSSSSEVNKTAGKIASALAKQIKGE
jgi:hypothetical protein